jgi:hypothetical protein
MQQLTLHCWVDVFERGRCGQTFTTQNDLATHHFEMHRLPDPVLARTAWEPNPPVGWLRFRPPNWKAQAAHEWQANGERVSDGDSFRHPWP